MDLKMFGLEKLFSRKEMEESHKQALKKTESDEVSAVKSGEVSESVEANAADQEKAAGLEEETEEETKEM